MKVNIMSDLLKFQDLMKSLETTFLNSDDVVELNEGTARRLYLLLMLINSLYPKLPNQLGISDDEYQRMITDVEKALKLGEDRSN